MWSILYTCNLKMAASNNNLWRREQIPQGRAGVIARALESFGRRGRGRGLGPPPLSVNCLGGLTTWEGHSQRWMRMGLEDYKQGIGGRVILPPCWRSKVLPPLEDHPLMMGACPRRRCQENPLSIPYPQLQPQQIQGIHPPPRYTPYDMEGPPYVGLYPSGQTIFSFWCWPFPTPPQSITLHLLIPLKTPLIQSQGTLMRLPHIPFMNLIMNQIGIYNIPPYPIP